MAFNSLTFLCFLLIVFLAHRLPLPWSLKKANLLLASYTFYAAWHWPMVFLLIGATVFNWLVAQRICSTVESKRPAVWLMFGLAGNVFVLGYFKYGIFLIENVRRLLGLPGNSPHWNIVLPIAISFFTFHNISYLMDVHRRKIHRLPTLLDYAFYLAFFPHLIAGPIVRASDFLPQCEQARSAAAGEIVWGFTLFVFGLFQKVVLADATLGPVANAIFDHAGEYRPSDCWVGVLAFSGQIFFDFAGYSTCAIGVAHCFGFRFPENFHSPYAADGFSDFWKRWHITLSSWLRDYLYIPLGGNRSSVERLYLNLMLTMLIGGLWHGAAWNFVFWGGLHGIYLITERILSSPRPARQQTGVYPAAFRLVRVLLTFFFVNLAWVFFRSKSFPNSFAMLAGLFGMSHGANSLATASTAPVIFVMASALALQFWSRERSLWRIGVDCHWALLSVVLASMIFCLCTMPENENAFIYFQF